MINATPNAAAKPATSPAPTAPVEIVPASRDTMRAKIFATKSANRKVIEFFGTSIELRQPLLGDVIQARDNVDREAAVIETLIKYAYIPGTNDRVFEDGDADSFKVMPFGADFLRVSNALEELTEVNFLAKKADSGGTARSS